MKTTHEILITYWCVSPAEDRHEMSAMKMLGEIQQVYEPEFNTGTQHILKMTARFNADSESARLAAAAYALSNAKKLHPKCSLTGITIYLNGEKIITHNGAFVPQN